MRTVKGIAIGLIAAIFAVALMWPRGGRLALGANRQPLDRAGAAARRPGTTPRSGDDCDRSGARDGGADTDRDTDARRARIQLHLLGSRSRHALDGTGDRVGLLRSAAIGSRHLRRVQHQSRTAAANGYFEQFGRHHRADLAAGEHPGRGGATRLDAVRHAQSLSLDAAPAMFELRV